MVESGHFIIVWSQAPNHITAILADSHLVALGKCSADMLGVRSLKTDLDRDSSGVIYAESSAAPAIARRKCAGQLRHINVISHWPQEKQDKEYLEYRKEVGTGVPSDLVTKYLTRPFMAGHSKSVGRGRVAGRAKVVFQIQGQGGAGAQIKVAVTGSASPLDEKAWDPTGPRIPCG